MASATQFLDFVFATQGQDTSVNPKVAPPGVMEFCVNGDFDQTGGLTLRPGFSPIVMNGVDAYDLYSYGDALYALGSSGDGHPEDLYVLNNVVAANPWRAMNGGNKGISVGSEVDTVSSLPFPGENSACGSVAIQSSSGLVASVLSAFGEGDRTTRIIHIVDPVTDATVFSAAEELSLSSGIAVSWVVALSTGDFGWVRQNSGTITLSIIDVTGPSAASMGAPITLANDLDEDFAFARMMVVADSTRIHLLYIQADDDIAYRQFTHAGSQNGTGKIVAAATAATKFAMAVSATQVHTVVQTTSTNLQMLTFGIASPFTTAVGPTNVTTAAMLSSECIELAYFPANTDNELWLFYCTGASVTASTLVVETRGETNHVLDRQTDYDQFNLIGGAGLLNGEMMALVRHVAWRLDSPDIGYGATALLRFSQTNAGFQAHPVLFEDRQIARFTAAGGNFGFNLAGSGTAVYFLATYQVSSGAQHSVLRRVLIDSESRRPAVELGGLLYLAGACPMVTDGRQLVESGMPPPDLAFSSQTTGGDLTEGGVYKYRAHYEWQDSRGNKHLSPVSQEIEVTLTGTNQTVFMRSQVPPNFRAYPQDDQDFGSAPVLKLFRTETNVEEGPAVLAGVMTSSQLSTLSAGGINSIETFVPSAKLTLAIDGGAPVTVTFGPTVTTLQGVADAIEAQVSGVSVVVNSSANGVTITTDAEGTAASIDAGPTVGGVVRLFLGLADAIVTGTTEASAGEIFFLTETVQARPDPTLSEYAPYITVEDDRSDASLLEKETLYTTGDRGAVSGVLDFAPPLPATYIAATRDRIVAASPNLVQVSQKAFPNEAIAFVDTNLVGPVGFAYQARVDGKITGVAAIDDSIVVGTRDELFVIGGDGPNYVGIGEFSTPARLPSEVGFYDWRSIVLTSEGLWFLGDVDKLYLLPRGGGVPTWAGEAVQRRLGTFISGAAVTEGDSPRVAFAVGDAARAVVRDIKAQQWVEYALPATPARTWIEHRGKFYFVTSSGDVWQQTAFTDNGAVIPLTVTTATVSPFGQNRQGRLRVVQLLGEFKTAATVKLEVSYDDGTTYVDMGTYTVSGLAADAPVRLQWFPHPQRGDRFKFRWTMTPSTATQGLVLNGFTLGVVPSRGETKLDAARRK